MVDAANKNVSILAQCARQAEEKEGEGGGASPTSSKENVLEEAVRNGFELRSALGQAFSNTAGRNDAYKADVWSQGSE
eukprot:7579156-Alexandrium_andersonii.AAC.1